MNVIYINTHDSGRVLSPYGYDIPTDNLKEFAKDALTFTNTYCVGPTCSPSRASNWDISSSKWNARFSSKRIFIGKTRKSFS